jgi:hypothetical protein
MEIEFIRRFVIARVDTVVHENTAKLFHGSARPIHVIPSEIDQSDSPYQFVQRRVVLEGADKLKSPLAHLEAALQLSVTVIEEPERSIALCELSLVVDIR